MKRVGFLMEKMMTEENFILAERLLGLESQPQGQRPPEKDH